jgi:prepilin-type N-terminal cleavage/methylation domain-containing protein
MKNQTCRGASLIELLIVVVIIALLASVLYIGFGSRVLPISPASPDEAGRPDGQGTTVAGAAVARAKDEKCRQQISQIRQIISMDTMAGEPPPASLQEAGTLPASFLQCPIGGETYVYDPSSGRVTCPHPGHEGF